MGLGVNDDYITKYVHHNISFCVSQFDMMYVTIKSQFRIVCTLISWI